MTTRNAASMGTIGAHWQWGGYAGCGNVTNLLNSVAEQPALIAGGGHSVLSDMKCALVWYPNALIFAVNDIGMFLPKVDHWVSLHADNLPAWKAVRWLSPKETEPKYHSTDKRPWVDYAWEYLTPCFALSGYFAMQIAYLMGCNPIILCGVPGDDSPRFFDLHKRTDFRYDDKGVWEQLVKELERVPDLRNRVQSMSGKTMELFRKGRV